MHCNYHIMYVFVGNKNLLVRTKIYGSKIYYNLLLHRNNNWCGQELTDTSYTQNTLIVCVVVANEKNGLPKRFVCVFSNN
jgi:hypothetical protein